MTEQKKEDTPHVYGTADPDNRQPPPANGMRGEGAATVSSPRTDGAGEETDPDAANRRGK